MRLRNALNASARNGTLDADLAGLDQETLSAILADWDVWARDDQLPPVALENGEEWRTWLILGGRGAGKTRTGAEWVKAKALGAGGLAATGARRIALIGETMAEVRGVMVEGPSGLLAIHDDGCRPKFEPSKGLLTWANGAIAQMFSAENAEALRGPQFDAAWCDEIGKWRNGEVAWDMLQFGLRLGSCPQVVATTTPRPVPLLRKIMDDAMTFVTHASTQANAANLAPTFVADMERRYAGTALGRQELLGELIEDDSGCLWRRDWIEDARVETVGNLRSVVVGVDPPVTATARSDACGILVAGVCAKGQVFVLADRTVQGREPNVWARSAVQAYHDFAADRIVAEINQGGDLVVSVLHQIDRRVPVRKVRATRGKWLRAEPVAALYAEGRVSHCGTFDALEDQMCSFGLDGRSLGKSPDRLDALVWAVSDLVLAAVGEPSVRML